MPKTLRILSFNIAHGRGLSLYQGFHGEKRLRRQLSAIAKIIQNTQVDVAALQEVDQDSHWNKRLDLLEIIKEECRLEHSLYGINTRREGPRNLLYGNGMLSRYPIHIWENNPFGNATLGEKGFLYTEMNIDGHALPLINLHLDYRSRKRRINQVEQIIGFLTEKPHPGRNHQPLAPIICGDFNCRSTRTNDAVNHLLNFVRQHGNYHILPERARTFPAYFPSKTIDFIMVPEPYRVVHSEVIRTFTSDHRPVLAEIVLD